jgi:hypothetical protein
MREAVDAASDPTNPDDLLLNTLEDVTCTDALFLCWVYLRPALAPECNRKWAGSLLGTVLIPTVGFDSDCKSEFVFF